MAGTTRPRASEWLAFKDVEIQTGIPSTSLRRFAEKFPAFLAGKRVERAICFPPESLPIFRRIHELFREGKHTAEVNTILALEHVATLDVDAIPTSVTRSSAANQAPDLAPMVREFTTSMDKLTAALDRQGELQARSVAAIEALAAAQRETVELLRQQQAQLAEVHPTTESGPRPRVWQALVEFFRGVRHVQ